LVWRIEGERVRRCPARFITKDTYHFIEAYNWFKRGYLPASGTISDQTLKFRRVIQVIEETVSEFNEKNRMMNNAK